MEMKFKTEHTQATEKVLMDMLTTGHAVATYNLKDAFYSYFENMFRKMILKEILEDHFIRELERWSKALKFMDAFTQKVYESRTITNPLATFVRL